MKKINTIALEKYLDETIEAADKVKKDLFAIGHSSKELNNHIRTLVRACSIVNHYNNGIDTPYSVIEEIIRDLHLEFLITNNNNLRF